MKSRSILRTALLLAAGTGLACPAFHTRERDVDRTPIVTTGAGATIIYPGQSPPVYQGPYHPKESGRGSYGQPGTAGPGGAATGAPPPQPGGVGGAAPGAPPATPDPRSAQGRAGAQPAPSGGSSITMLGGTTVEEERHQRIDEEPVWWKYVTLPFAVVAAPFVYVADAVRPDPEPGPEVPRLENAPPPAPAGPPPMDYETATMQRLEAELEQRGETPAESAATGSFAEELAALRRAQQRPQSAPRAAEAGRRSAAPTPSPRPDAARPPAPTRPAPTTPAADPALAAASGHVDRDGDGRTDHWIFRERGEIVKELLDEDFDGRPDRTLHYDLATHQVRAIEEDADYDGRVDTWTSLRDGAIVRRRADGDGDGHVDTWSYYDRGELTRLERDATGDGFRDRVSHYVGGRLAREEQDDDADGRADVVKHYDENERIRRLDEDTDGDGEFDVISHFEDGRLTRRELLDAEALAPAPRMTEHN